MAKRRFFKATTVPRGSRMVLAMARGSKRPVSRNPRKRSRRWRRTRRAKEILAARKKLKTRKCPFRIRRRKRQSSRSLLSKLTSSLWRMLRTRWMSSGRTKPGLAKRSFLTKRSLLRSQRDRQVCAQSLRASLTTPLRKVTKTMLTTVRRLRVEMLRTTMCPRLSRSRCPPDVAAVRQRPHGVGIPGPSIRSLHRCQDRIPPSRSSRAPICSHPSGMLPRFSRRSKRRWASRTSFWEKRSRWQSKSTRMPQSSSQ
mmetsp:Transcript_271/g.1117  ORF Transcript_271/g.1117 Transcript_271/m.1117 type:complete len:255 (-) Transcript_271:1066-1830(-)